VFGLGKQGVENIHPMNIGGKKLFDFGSVKCVNAVHSAVVCLMELTVETQWVL
jgi:hypothetical protein